MQGRRGEKNDLRLCAKVVVANWTCLKVREELELSLVVVV